MNERSDDNPDSPIEDGTAIIDSPFGPESRAPSARLVVVAGPNCGRAFDLVASTALLGRGEDCDIVLDDPSVSRRHIRVEAIADRWFGQDLGSGNGTYVGGTRTDRFPLDDGLVFSLGATAVRFERLGPIILEGASNEDAPGDDATRMVSIASPEPPASPPDPGDGLAVAPPPRLAISTTPRDAGRPARLPRWMLPSLVGVATACVVAGAIWWLTDSGRNEEPAPTSSPSPAAVVDSQETDFERAIQALGERRWDAALHLLQGVRSRTPEHDGIEEAIGRARDERRNMQVLDAARRVLERDDAADEALELLSRIDAASVYHEEARTLAGEIQTRRITARVTAIRDLVRDRQAAAAREAYSELAASHPDAPEVQTLRAELESAGILPGERGAARAPRAPAPVNGRSDLARANAAYDQGDFDRASSILEQAAASGDPDVAQRASVAAQRVARFSRAHREGTRALLDKRLESARTNLLKALAADASLTRHYQAEIRGMLGEACRGLAVQAQDRGDCTLAAQRAREALDYRPGDALSKRVLDRCGGP